MQFAPPITLDKMAVISLVSLEESPDSNVRFCLGAGRKANILGSVHETEKIVR